MKISKFVRFLNIALTIISFIAYVSSLLLFIAFSLDIHILDKYNIFPRMSRNKLFEGLFNEADILGRSLFNVLISLPFCIHHVLFTNQQVRKAFNETWKSYYVIEKPLFLLSKHPNIESSILLILLLALWQPILLIKVEIPEETAWFYILSSYGYSLLLFSLSLPLSLKIDRFGFKMFYDVATKEEIPERDDTPVVGSTPFIYKFLRHPHRSATLAVFLFGSRFVSVGRVLFGIGFVLFVFYSIHDEERDLAERSGEYREYLSKVTSRLIPNPLCYLRFESNSKTE